MSRWDAVRAKKRNLPGSLSDHKCHARGCSRTVPERMQMCRFHWAMVPIALRRRVWAEYVPGQELRKDPSAAYLKAAQAAIDAVYLRETAGRRAMGEQMGLGL